MDEDDVLGIETEDDFDDDDDDFEDDEDDESDFDNVHWTDTKIEIGGTT